MKHRTLLLALALAVPLALGSSAQAETEFETEASCKPPTCPTKTKLEAEWESNTAGTSIKFKAKVVTASTDPPTIEVNPGEGPAVLCTLDRDPRSTPTRNTYRVSGRLKRGVTTWQIGNCEAIPTGITEGSTVVEQATGLTGIFGLESDD